MKPFSLILCLGLSLSALAQGPQMSDLQKRVQEIMNMEHRSQASKDRDRNRNPVRALEFFRIREDMKVLEFMPGAGWYTEILGPLLNEKGELIVATNPNWIPKNLNELLKTENFSNVKVYDNGIGWDRENRCFDTSKMKLDVADLDMVLSIREYHGFSNEGAQVFNKQVFKALKPGGYYAIIDHTRRHMEAESGENGRRRDPVLIIKHLLDAGFEFVDYSDMFFRPDDELRYEVGRKTVTGNTDRFTFLFRKPEA
ncbi:Class I SAM-dependent methyltransferase [Sulfidibacter corallicola]|uniref:Class I SAM-dependent methyltransferase n=1 Tax=Sulfidibacter corallicola TaxID=2818388 RepID=A0A8A4TLW9_SULCO|nr:hypothetical protein [Sulfidibacter corallicola]QTD50204.1 class I SAM-dependent methyltransferase [Sulfidibacter corallicola]